MRIELFSTEGCGLCVEALQMLAHLRKEFLFELSEVKMTEEHPRFAEWHVAVPVVIIDGVKEFKGKVSEDDVRQAIRDLYPPTPLYYTGKFLEAVGFLAVAVGLMYGCAGDMYTDLYFFLAGIAIFSVGRVLERSQLKRLRPSSPPKK